MRIVVMVVMMYVCMPISICPIVFLVRICVCVCVYVVEFFTRQSSSLLFLFSECEPKEWMNE